MANVTVNKINTDFIEDYTQQDLNLIPAFDIISQFSPETDEVEFSIYNEQNLLEYITYNYTDYTVTLDYNTQGNSISTVNVDVEKDVINAGYNQGNYSATYNFLRNQLSSSASNPFYIKEISSDRTEIRIANNSIENEDLENLVNNFRAELSSSAYFEDFHLNFGNNNIFIANNILIDTSTPSQYTVLVKLYEPLEDQFEIKNTLWVALQTANEVSYQVNFVPRVEPSTPPKSLQGPNFEIKSKDIVNNSTTYQNLNSLNSIALTSSYNELQSILAEKGIVVNIDYSDFNEFIYFSSAEERVRNFYYKVSEIEAFQNELNNLVGSGGINFSNVSSSVVILENKIQNIIQNFDGFEKYEYYSSGSSNIYPKSNSTPPYNLQSSGSTEVLSWLEDQATTSGSNYDIENPDRLVNSLPSFVVDNTDNAQFLLFMDMIGQHFDNIWVYTKDIVNRFDADNRLNYGISKDIVADAIRSMGVNLYQNNFSSDDLSSAYIGIIGSGSLLPPTGSEVIETYITASSEITKLDDVNKETYKRLFHNLPYLLKKKGTIEGLRTLINTYGIPDTILRISEFGGKDKENSNDWDYFQNKFNYALYCSGSTVTDKVHINGWEVNSNWNSYADVPETVVLRFKPDSLPEEETHNVLAYKDSTAWYLTLSYTGSSYSSGSYSGSIPSASNDYATLTLWNGGFEVTHIDAPFYDGNWWGVQMSRQGVSSAEVTLRAANSIYKGNDGFKIGHTASIVEPAQTFVNWVTKTGSPKVHIPYVNNGGVTLDANTYYGLTGSFQEIRFYNEVLNEDTFHDYVMNPYSIEGLTSTTSAENLIFRAPLGTDLYTYTGSLDSTHPKITGSLTFITNSFSDNSTYYISSSNNNLTFYPQKEFIYYDQPAVGIKNRISEKIRIANNITPSGDTLTPYRTIQQRYIQSESYTRDVNYVEVAFSPQNEINDDINSSFGYFDIGEYIGDPRQIPSSSTSYPDLDSLRDTYFKKYYKNYNWVDYVRLIKYFDNSLFKIIKDFTPAKSGITTGVVIKQHLLERNRQRPPQVEISQYDYSGSITSSFIEGGDGGIFDNFNLNNGNASLLTYRSASVLNPANRDSSAGTVVNSYGFGFGGLGGNTYGITGSEGGLTHIDGIQTTYPIKNISSVPITFDFELTGTVDNANLVEGALNIFSNTRFTTGSGKVVEKIDAGSIFSASIGDINDGSDFTVSASGLVIYPGERLAINISQIGSNTTDIINSFITLSPSKIHNNPTFNTQYWEELVLNNSGSTLKIHDSQDEFYNGELSGSNVLVTNGNLNVPIFTETNNSFVSSYPVVAAYNNFSQFYTGFVSTPDGFFSYYWSTINSEEEYASSFPSYISIADDDNDGNDREAFFDSLSAGDRLNFRVTTGSYVEGQNFYFQVGSVTKTTSGANKRYIISVEDSNANFGDWYSNRSSNSSLNPPAFKLELVYDDSLDTFIGFNEENSNPLYNNASQARVSEIYNDVDYSDGVITPVNYNNILAGNATKAPVQDSNYSQRVWINSRYNGSRNSSIDFNQKTGNSSAAVPPPNC